MTQNKFTTNNNPILAAVSNADGETPVYLYADPATHGLVVSTAATAIADGADVAEGATTDAAVTAGSPGTVSGKLRQISADVSSVKTNTTGASTTANQTNGTQQTKITDGTNITNVLKSDGTAAGQNAALVAGAYQEKPTLSAGSLNADLVASLDVSNYKEFSLQVAGVFVGTLTFQGSNDNTNFVSINVSNITTLSSSMATTATGPGVLYGLIHFRYLRVRMTAYTSGTATGTLELYTSPSGVHSPAISNSVASTQLGTWTVGSNSATGSAIPANAFYMGMSDGTLLQPLRSATNVPDAGGASSLATGLTAYNGGSWDRVRTGGVLGMLGVSIQASPSGAFTFGHISTAATTTLKSGSGTLHNVSVNTLGTVASTATIYDSTTGSGTVIGVINTLNLSGSFILDVAFTTGLTIVTTGTIAPDLTVSYK